MDNQTPPTANSTNNPTAVQTPPPPKSFLSTKIILLIVIVLILIASGGTYLALNSKSKPQACTQEAKVCPDGTSVGRTGPNCAFSPCPTKPTPETKQESVLKIPEYGVQITLSDEIKDAYYINTTASKGYVYLKVHSLDIEPQCKKDDSSTASLSRVGKDEINPMTNGKYSDSFKGKIIGNYFYYIDLAQYSCADTTEGKAKLEKVRSAFTTAEITQ